MAIASLALLGLLALNGSVANAQDDPEPPSSPKDVREILAKPIDLVAHSQPLVRVAIYLQRHYDLPIFFDTDIVPGSSTYGDPTVTCDFHEVPLGRVLREILTNVDMDYVVKNHSVLIVTRERARLLNRWPTGSAKSANEAKVTAVLEEPVDLDFSDQPLTDVVDYLKQKFEIDIQLDGAALKTASVSADTPITRTVSGITLESALDLVLNDVGLTWAIGDEVLLITTRQGARRLIETRVYPVFDLVMLPPGQLPPVDGPDYDALVELLSESTSADEDVVTPIRVYRPAGALVVTRSVAGHRRLEKLLADLRRAKAAQSSVP